MAGNSTGGARATNQAGVLGGLNPSKYNPKDPLTTFIIQVGFASRLSREEVGWLMTEPHGVSGRPHHRRLPCFALASLEAAAASGHC